MQHRDDSNLNLDGLAALALRPIVDVSVFRLQHRDAHMLQHLSRPAASQTTAHFPFAGRCSPGQTWLHHYYLTFSGGCWRRRARW